VLDLRCNDIGQGGLEALALGLVKQTELRELHLQDNPVRGARPLACSLPAHLPARLPACSLPACQPARLRCSQPGRQQAWSRCRRSTPHPHPSRPLPSLPPGGTTFASFLSTTSCLVTLDLCNAGITDDAAVQMAAALKHNTSLTYLNLKANCVADCGGKALAGALRGNHSLLFLQLESNR
jgi:hypothetical protein